MAKKPRKTAAPASSTSSQSEVANIQTPARPSGRPQRPIWTLLFDTHVRRAFYLVLLAATYAPLSQLILSPVYGSIPAAIYHKYGMLASVMLSFAIKDYVPLSIEKYFGPFVFWIPVLHFVLFRYSSVLGSPTGPLVTDCLTTYPLITLSMHLAAKQFEKLDLRFLNRGVAEAGPSMINYLMFTIFERLLKGMLPTWMGVNVLFSRVGFQMLLAASYTAILPQSLLWPSLPAIAFNTIGNVHSPLSRTTDVLQNTLALHNYSLVERRESLTGYLSVLEDNERKFRIMRCDHSLLGGDWILPSDAKGKRQVAEPVYAVFTMLEAVRLVDRGRDKQKSPGKALNIGLGVGTAPSALIAHGIDTTIIELDPVVHAFATKYFGLPQKHLAYLGDAVGIIENKKEGLANNYDYIIHDVFTGGAEPADLFTFEFLSGLKQMLKSDGVIAINYAGDLAMPSTSLIYRTILEVFPSCRVFREDEQIAEENEDAIEQDGEFTNMVFLCNKGDTPVKFREAVEADFLGSSSRRAYMVPKFEVAASKFEREGELLTRANTKALEKMQVQSAIGHWKLMRKVIPDAIWENW